LSSLFLDAALVTLAAAGALEAVEAPDSLGALAVEVTLGLIPFTPV
jgi:hypothetical protein